METICRVGEIYMAEWDYMDYMDGGRQYLPAYLSIHHKAIFLFLVNYM